MADVPTQTEDPPSQGPRVLVGYQGTDGAYSQIAAERHFAAKAGALVTRGYVSFAALLDAVLRGEIDYAMQPIENTTAGSITEAYDLLARLDLQLVGEEILRVEHCLLALPGSERSMIRRVYSHPQALLQCSEFLGALPDCEVLAFADTAMAVEKVSHERDPAQAAVASARAGALYGLSVLARDIANQRHNYTRFVVAAKRGIEFPVTTPCKTSLIFTTAHERGALVRCLNVLADHGLSLTKLESRPRPGTPFEYIFYADFEGNVADPTVADAVEGVRAHTLSLKLLGSYPPARTDYTGTSASTPTT